MELNGTRQLLFSVDDVSLLVGNVYKVYDKEKLTGSVSKEVGLEVNTEKTKYMFMSRHQNRNVKVVNMGVKPGLSR
jgi:hypothetical protein